MTQTQNHLTKTQYLTETQPDWSDWHTSQLYFVLMNSLLVSYKLLSMEMVTASSLFLSSSSVGVIVINQNCQKTSQILADPQFFKADTPFFAIFLLQGCFCPT